VLLDGAATGERVPHMGWNSVDLHADDEPLFRGLPAKPNFYFVHSYHFRTSDDGDVAGTTPYCGAFASVVRRGNICGTQFHPEKSQRAGFQLLENFLKQ
jgi:glutamine amidotransferase